MGWAVGFYNGRDVGYGVPAWCDHPDCNEEVDRGLSYVCGRMHGADDGCGLYFCSEHLFLVDDPKSDGMVQLCERCVDRDEEGLIVNASFTPKPDHPEWLEWKLTDESWAKWRDEYPDEVAAARAVLTK